jgi:Uma2 family endonuclease
MNPSFISVASPTSSSPTSQAGGDKLSRTYRATCPYFVTAPDWVCEVLSAPTQALDRSEKMDVYARERVGHAWLVDPIARTLEVYRLREARWERLGVWHGDAVVRAEPFEALELDRTGLWRP